MFLVSYRIVILLRPERNQLLPTTLVVQIEQSLRCVSNEMTSDLDIWQLSSQGTRAQVKIQGLRMTNSDMDAVIGMPLSCNFVYKKTFKRLLNVYTNIAENKQNADGSQSR